MGAIVKPYGFPEPLAGSTVEPMTTWVFNCSSSDESGATPALATTLLESTDCCAAGVTPLPPPPLQPVAIRIAASADATLPGDPQYETDTEFLREFGKWFYATLAVRREGTLK